MQSKSIFFLCETRCDYSIYSVVNTIKLMHLEVNGYCILYSYRLAFVLAGYPFRHSLDHPYSFLINLPGNTAFNVYIADRPIFAYYEGSYDFSLFPSSSSIRWVLDILGQELIHGSDSSWKLR